MNVEIVDRGGEANAALKRYIGGKVGKLDKLFDDIQSVRVVLQKEKFSHRVEVTVVDKHGSTSGRETKEDFRSAFDLVLDKLEARGRKSKALIKEEKRRQAPSRRKKGAQAWEVNVIDRLSLAEEDVPRVVSRSTTPITPMTVEDAALSLDRSKNEFIVFRNESTDRVSVLYRRRDNNFGLIEPEF